MIKVIDFKKEHLQALLEQPLYQHLKSNISEAHMEDLEKKRNAYTCMTEDGRILIVAGVTEYWKGRGEAWALFDRESKKDLLLIHRAVRRFLEICPVRRIEATVDVDSETQHRWIKSLGFEMEAPRLRKFTSEGKDASLYVRIR